jgi:glyoxylase-like metal-dependent hydrolase (beta-lactamase superfamily II)
MGERLSFPIISWCITGTDAAILVDTGASPPDKTSEIHFPYTQTSDQTLTAHLKRLGLNPIDIDVVIYTHLHWDHCHNSHLFPRAKFYVQREELRYAAAPAPIHAYGYDSANVGLVPPFATISFDIVQGDKEIVPGISLILTPGHTPGSQGVLVESSAGAVFVAGDTLPLFENRLGTPRHPFPLPNGVYTDIEAYYRTFARLADIENEARIILPGHDPAVFDRDRYP